MNKKLIAAAVAAVVSMPALVLAEDAAPASPHTFTANVGVVSDYVFRGITQSGHKPAIQGGFDYSHASGFYAGTWLSSISWVSDQQNKSVPTEIDIYGGYKNTFAGGDWNYDVGYITYNYPGSSDTPANSSAKADTQELYGALGWKWLSAKYSYVTSSHFVGWSANGSGLGKTNGSNYLELNATYDLGNGWGISGHYGHQKVKNFVPVAPITQSASYSDWNVGVTKDVGFGVVGLKYSGTDVKGTCNDAGTGTSAYCWGNWNGTASTGNYKAAKDVVILSFTKSF